MVLPARFQLCRRDWAAGCASAASNFKTMLTHLENRFRLAAYAPFGELLMHGQRALVFGVAAIAGGCALAPAAAHITALLRPQRLRKHSRPRTPRPPLRRPLRRCRQQCSRPSCLAGSRQRRWFRRISAICCCCGLSRSRKNGGWDLTGQFLQRPAQCSLRLPVPADCCFAVLQRAAQNLLRHPWTRGRHAPRTTSARHRRPRASFRPRWK